MGQGQTKDSPSWLVSPCWQGLVQWLSFSSLVSLVWLFPLCKQAVVQKKEIQLGAELHCWLTCEQFSVNVKLTLVGGVSFPPSLLAAATASSLLGLVPLVFMLMFLFS